MLIYNNDVVLRWLWLALIIIHQNGKLCEVYFTFFIQPKLLYLSPVLCSYCSQHGEQDCDMIYFLPDWIINIHQWQILQTPQFKTFVTFSCSIQSSTLSYLKNPMTNFELKFYLISANCKKKMCKEHKTNVCFNF